MSNAPESADLTPASEPIASRDAGTDADKKDAAQALDLEAAAKELSDMKLVVLEAAELANQSAGKATDVGVEFKLTTRNLSDMMQRQRKFQTVLISITGGVLVLLGLVFATITFTLKARINQMDEMLSATSSKIRELNEGLEVVGSVNEGFQEMVAKQAAMAAAQARLEVGLSEMAQINQNLPQEKAKQAEAREQALNKQVSALESGLKSQSQAINALAGQMQGLRQSMGDAGQIKRDMENLVKLQKERQASEANTAVAASKPKINAEPAPERPKERFVRYPRPETVGNPAQGSGVLSTQ
jgi:DNA repair exonuclease SbcCD ATPase subunit